MGNYGLCIDWVLRLEDRRLSGVVVDLGDGGGRTRFGITERWNPEVGDVFYDGDVEFALEFAKDLYWRNYWMPIRGALIASDELAATLLSFAVNDGVGPAVRLLQRAIGGLKIDGDLGEHTRSAIARGDSSDIAMRLRGAQEDFYRHIVELNPAKAVFLKGWIRRARAMYPDLP